MSNKITIKLQADTKEAKEALKRFENDVKSSTQNLEELQKKSTNIYNKLSKQSREHANTLRSIEKERNSINATAEQSIKTHEKKMSTIEKTGIEKRSQNSLQKTKDTLDTRIKITKQKMRELNALNVGVDGKDPIDTKTEKAQTKQRADLQKHNEKLAEMEKHQATVVRSMNYNKEKEAIKRIETQKKQNIAELKAKETSLTKQHNLDNKALQETKNLNNENINETKKQIESRKKLVESQKKELTDFNKRKIQAKKEFRQTYINTNATNAYQTAVKKLAHQKNIGAISTSKYAIGLKKEKANLKEATVAAKHHSKETSNLANQTIRYLRWAGTIVGVVYAIDRAWTATLGKGIAVNRMMEDNVSGIGALLSANTQMVLSNGNVVNSYEKFKLGQEVATKTMDDLRKASVKTYATFPQLTEIFQQAIGQTLSMGKAFGTTTKEINDNTIKLSQRMSNIAGAIGMPMDRAKEEIRSLLSGNASTDSLISTMIFGSPGEANKAIRMAKDRGERGLTDMLDSVLAPFDALENVDSYTKSLLLLEDAWSQLWATVSQPLTESMKSQYKHLAIAINFYKDSIVEAREEEEKAHKSRRTAEIVRELESLVNQQERLRALTSGGETREKGFFRTFFEGEDKPEKLEKKLKSVTSAIKTLEGEYNEFFKTASEGELVTKPSFDTKFLEKAQKKLNNEKSKTVKLEQELIKANEQKLLYTDFLKENEGIIAKDKETQVILDAQIALAKNATSTFTKLIKQDEEEIADIKLNAELRELRATQELLIAQGELLGVEVTKEEIIESNITLLEKELAGEKDKTKQMQLQTKIIKEKLKLEDGENFFEGWDTTISKTFVDGIQDALDGDFDFSSMVQSLSSSLGNALATQATTAMVGTIGTEDKVTGAMMGGMGLGIGLMAISSIIGNQEAAEEAKKIRDEKLQASVDGLKDATEKLYAQVFGAGTEIQQVLTRDMSKTFAEYSDIQSDLAKINEMFGEDTTDLIDAITGKTELVTEFNNLATKIKGFTSELVDSIDAISEFSDSFGDLSDELSGTTAQADIRGEKALEETYALFGISTEAEFQAKLDELVGITEFRNAEAIKEGLTADVSSQEYKDALDAVSGLTTPVIDAINNYDTLAEAVDYLNKLEQERIDNGEVILSLAEARNLIEDDIIAQWTEADDRLNSLSNTFDTLGESIEDTIATLLGGSDAFDAQDRLIEDFWNKQSELDVLLATEGQLSSTQEARLSDLVGDINQLSVEIQKASIGENTNITNELVTELGALQDEIAQREAGLSVQDTIDNLTQTTIDYLGADSEIVFWLKQLNGNTEDLGFDDYTVQQTLQEAYDTVDGSHADGLSYVPFDGYKAKLHQGERVLTKAENNRYPSSSQIQSYASQASDPEIKELLTKIDEKLGKIQNLNKDTRDATEQLAFGAE